MWIESPSSQEFRDFHAEFDRADVPTRVHLDITYRCDLDCEHCYLDDKETWPEMKTADLKRVVDELADLGVMHLLWSGGEVFARPDFEDLLTHAAAKGFLSQVKTHGGNLTAERVAFLQAVGVVDVQVSVYSLDDEVHDGVTRVPGSLARTLRGIQLCKDAGLHVRVGIVAMPVNVDEIEDMLRYFQDMDVACGVGMRMYDDHAASGATQPLKLSEEELIRVRMAHMRAMSLNPRDLAFNTMKTEGRTCGAATELAYVTPDGSVWPCVMFPMPLGNLHERSFGDIWRYSEGRKEVAAFQQSSRTDCHGCAASGACEFCKGEAFKQSGDFRVAPPSFHFEAAAAVKAAERLTGERLSPEAWATIPSGEVTAPRKRKATFPIYRPGRVARDT